VLREDTPKVSKVPSNLWNALSQYKELLDQHRYLDYSRIMVDAVEALNGKDEHSRALQKKIGERIKYLIVDEYQDVNPIQETLVQRLHALGANVCVVGDDDQTIYQWRSSKIENILEFAKRYPQVESITLAKNFRSSNGVVETARQIAEKNNPRRLPKAMIAANSQPFERGDLLAMTFDSPEREAKWIAKKILEMRGASFKDDPKATPRGLSWSDCVILLRSVRRNGEAVVRALDAAGIPYLINGLSNLFDAPEIQACVLLFDYITKEVTAKEVKNAWIAANLGLTTARISKGMAILDAARSWKKGQRWGAYNIQRVFLNFLEALNLREETIPPTNSGEPRGELVYYNFGKFSQVISDYEQIHFQSEPQEKYTGFIYWLRNEAPAHYEEGGEDAGFAQPDAVQIMTVHKAKGMEWPVVFIPALQNNRFPSVGTRGRSKWHILPKDAVPDADRYDGSIEDERRLFYVAVTRSKKYLYCSFAPVPDNQLYRKPSEFFQDFIRSPNVLTAEPKRAVKKIAPKPKRETPNVVLSFSELKYFFECPYSFKLRFLYGFNPPLHEALGLGKSLHDALSQLHKQAISGQIIKESEIEPLVDRHLHTPFAYPKLKEHLRAAAVVAIRRYLQNHGASLTQTVHSEQQVEIQVSPGITVNGRIDLIKKLDTGEVAIVDFKSTERSQAEDVTRTQLHTYAIGYQQLTGKNADLVEILNLDAKGKNIREVVDGDLLKITETEIRRAGEGIRNNKLERLAKWCKSCAECDLVGLCRRREA